MSCITENGDGLGWDVNVTRIGGDPDDRSDDEYFDRADTIADAALLLAQKLAEQTERLIEGARAEIAEAERAFMQRQVELVPMDDRLEALAEQQAALELEGRQMFRQFVPDA